MNERDRIVQFLKENLEMFINALCMFYPLSTGFIEKYEEFLNWEYITQSQGIRLDLEFCKKFRHRLNWEELTPRYFDECYSRVHDPFNAEFLEEFKNEINWGDVCYIGLNNLLTEEVIEKFRDKIDWENLSANYHFIFTEELIRRHEDKWDWEELSGSRNMPWRLDFIMKYKDKWDWRELQYNRDVLWTMELLQAVEDYIDPHRYEFLEKYCLGIEKRFYEEFSFDPFKKKRTKN